MPVAIFCCYARKDQLLLNELITHLAPLKREGLITIWADTDIGAGVEWEREIKKHLKTAQVILLLVSSDFMASDYINDIELKQAIERHERGEAYVLPIILRPTHWQEAPFGKLQVLPTNGNPVTGPAWYNKDEAFYDVEKGIRKVVTKLSSKTSTNLTSMHMNITEGVVTDRFLEPNFLPYSTIQPDSIIGSEKMEQVGIQTNSPEWEQIEKKAGNLINFKRPMLVLAVITCAMLLVSFIFVPISIPSQVAILLTAVIFTLSLILIGQLEQWYWFIGVLLVSPVAGIGYLLFDPMPLTVKWYWFIGLLVPSSLSGIVYGLYGPEEKPRQPITHKILKQLILIISVLGFILLLFALVESAPWLVYLSLEFVVTGYILTLIQLIRLRPNDWLENVLVATFVFFPIPIIGIAYGFLGPTVPNPKRVVQENDGS